MRGKRLILRYADGFAEEDLQEQRARNRTERRKRKFTSVDTWMEQGKRRERRFSKHKLRNLDVNDQD